MAGNLSIKITADVVDLQAKFAVAKSESAALTAELNKLAREARGGMTDELKGKLTSAAEAMLTAKARTSELASALHSELEPNIRSASSALRLAKEAAGAFGVALSVSAAISFGRSLLDSTAAIGSEARAINVSTDALQAYRTAAVEAGGSTEEADTAIRVFTKSLGLAAETNALQRKAFADLGLTAKDLAGGTEASLPKVASALLSIQDATRRAADEAALFGRSGQDVERFLQAWADPNIVAAMKADGQVIDEELIKRAEKFESEWSAGWTRFKVEAISSIGAAQDAITNAEAKVKQFFAQIPAGVTAEGQPFGGGLATTPWSGPFANASTQALAAGGGQSGGSGGGYSWADDPKAIAAAREHAAALLEIQKYNDEQQIQTWQKDEQLFKALADGEVGIEASKYEHMKAFDEDRVKSANQIGQRIAETNKHWLDEWVRQEDEMAKRTVQVEQAAAAEKARVWTSMLQPFNAALGQMLSGHANYANIAAGLERGLVLKVIQGIEQMVIAWAVGDTALKSLHSSQVLADAKVAFANTYAAVSAIPVIGPYVAPVAAAGAFAAVAAYDSFDVGSYRIGESGLAMVHAGEMIAPARSAEAWRDNISNTSNAGHTFNFHNTVNGAGSADIMGHLENNSRRLAGIIKDMLRGGYAG